MVKGRAASNAPGMLTGKRWKPSGEAVALGGAAMTLKLRQAALLFSVMNLTKSGNLVGGQRDGVAVGAGDGDEAVVAGAGDVGGGPGEARRDGQGVSGLDRSGEGDGADLVPEVGRDEGGGLGPVDGRGGGRGGACAAVEEADVDGVVAASENGVRKRDVVLVAAACAEGGVRVGNRRLSNDDVRAGRDGT